MDIWKHSFTRTLVGVVTLLLGTQLVLSVACMMVASPLNGTPLQHHELVSVVSNDVNMPKQCAELTEQYGSSQHHSQHPCYHCNAPDQISANITMNDIPTPVLALLVQSSSHASVNVAYTPVSIAVHTRTPTGPPRSSSLLFTTTQRIRV